MLHKKGFKISIFLEAEDDDNDALNKNDTYYNLFKSMPVNMVTT